MTQFTINNISTLKVISPTVHPNTLVMANKETNYHISYRKLKYLLTCISLHLPKPSAS